LDGHGEPKPLNTLQAALEQAAAAANLAGERLAMIDLTDPVRAEYASLRGLEPVYPASVIKVAVMVEAEHQVEQGTIDLGTTYTVTEEQHTCTGYPPGDTRLLLQPGNTASVQYLVDLMITRSDNTATNVLIDHLGRANVTAYMASLGLPTLQVHRKVFGCEPYDDTGWDGVSRNTMSARETAQLYRLILDGGPGFPGAESRTRMQGVLSRQLWRDGIFERLPAAAQYLSKTGETTTVKHDSGIILWGNRRYVIVAMLELSGGQALPRLRELGTQVTAVMESR
jgi:beta-lactamase class A